MSTNGPLLGYNNNIPYKGRVYHVQTEDSGAKRPHVITHLFADGGRIVNTTKTSYAHFVGGENLADKVRALMREQHRAMVVSLRDGGFDEIIDPTAAAAAELTPMAAEASEADTDLSATARVSSTGDATGEAPAEPEPAPPSEPIELLPLDERERRKSVEPYSDGAGSYKKIVGRATSAPAAPKGSVSPPGDNVFHPRRMAATKPHATARGGGALFGHAIRTHRPGPSGPPVVELHTEPFGDRYMSERSLNELVEAFFAGTLP